MRNYCEDKLLCLSTALLTKQRNVKYREWKGLEIIHEADKRDSIKAKLNQLQIYEGISSSRFYSDTVMQTASKKR